MCHTRYRRNSPNYCMNDFDNDNYCPFRNARWIADINIGKSGEDVCGSCRGPRYEDKDKDTGEDLIRQTSIRSCAQNTLTQNCLFYIFNPSKASPYQKISKGEYYCDNLGGYCMSEHLDQIVDRNAVGKEVCRRDMWKGNLKRYDS